MNHEIRPISQAPTAVDGNRESYVPDSPKGMANAKVTSVVEEHEVPHRHQRTASMESEKKEFDRMNHEALADEGIDWNPGFKQQFPWIGFAGFLTIIFATAMAVAILGLSNHKRVKDWPFERFPTQPNVLLNIANQVQNLGLITLIAQGLAIAWWRKALKGSSLGTLHRNHAYSYSFYAIMTSGKHFNLVALAALMTKFAVIDSTLFQKATKTVITQQKAYANVTVTGFVENMWKGNAGGIPGEEGRIKTVDVNWARVLEAYSGKIANGKVHDGLGPNASFFGCPFRQECSGAIKGIGFAFNCSTTVDNVDYGLQRQTQKGGVSTSYNIWDISFNTSFSTANKPYASIKMDMLYVDSHKGQQAGSCPGTLTRRSCDIRPAVVEYPIIVMTPSEEELKGMNIVTHVKFFANDKPIPINSPLNNTEQIDGLKVLEYVNLSERFNETSTVGALNFVMNNLYGSSANLTYDKNWDIVARGSSAQTIFFADSDKEDNDRCYYDIDRSGKDDPAVELLRKLNTLSFVTGLYLNGAPTTDVKNRKAAGMPSQDFRASVTGIVEEYHTSFGYVGGALAATLITVMFVLPVYWGFWQLGRKVTLGPLEITNAFGAPITRPDQTRGYHADFDQILEDVGHRRVQYGQVVGAPPGQMGIAEPEKIAKPSASHTWRVSRARQNRRIGMGAVIGGITAAIIGGSAKH